MRYQVPGLRRGFGVLDHAIQAAQQFGYRHTRASGISWKRLRSHPWYIHTCIPACLHTHADDGDEDVPEDEDDNDGGGDGCGEIMLR